MSGNVRKVIALALVSLILGAWDHGNSNSLLRQQNMFGLTGGAWQNTSNYYTPGTGNPAVSTADYYHLDGMQWMRPYDLLNAACGTAGSTIAAARGRYVWLASPDHPSGNFSWLGGQDFRAGYSNDPGVLPATLLPIIAAPYNNLINPQIASVTAKIDNGSGGAGNILTVSAVGSGWVGFDNTATISGSGVTTANIVSQSTGTTAGMGTYVLAGAAQLVSSETMTVSQIGFHIYQSPFLVCNPDDASFPFYMYEEGEGSRINNEEGWAKSADLINWTFVGPAMVNYTFSSVGYFSSFQRPVRDGVNTWHSTGFETAYPVAPTSAGYGDWSSTTGQTFTPNAVSLFNICIPTNATGLSGNCPGASALQANNGGTPDKVTVNSQTWSQVRLDTMVSGNRSGSQWVARVPIDSNFNVLTSPAPFLVSTAYAGNYPGPTYLQSTNAYVEDGIAHYYAQNGFFTSDAQFGTVGAATYANGGGLWQEGVDYYTEVLDSTAAVNAAPIGVVASCASSTVTVSWYNALPNNTYRVYRGTTAGSQTTLVGNVSGTSITDTPTVGSVYYYKVVTLNSGTEEKSRVVSTYVSSSSAFINAHVTRALAAGADPTTINITWLNSFESWMISNGLLNDLLFATMAEFGVTQNGSHVISTVFDLGTTRLPRGGDYTPVTTSTTYSATGIGGAPAWLNGANTAQGYFGGGLLNNIRRKTQITMFAAYQKPGTAQASLLCIGEFQGACLYHSSGAPGAANFLLTDATQTKTATATISGLATDFHDIAGVFDGTNLIAYADGVAGTSVTGLVIPSPNLNPPDALTGIVGQASQVPFLGSGSQDSRYIYGSGYAFDENQALFNGAALIVFDKALTPTQMTSLDSLIKGHF